MLSLSLLDCIFTLPSCSSLSALLAVAGASATNRELQTVFTSLCKCAPLQAWYTILCWGLTLFHVGFWNLSAAKEWQSVQHWKVSVFMTVHDITIFIVHWQQQFVAAPGARSCFHTWSGCHVLPLPSWRANMAGKGEAKGRQSKLPVHGGPKHRFVWPWLFPCVYEIQGWHLA